MKKLTLVILAVVALLTGRGTTPALAEPPDDPFGFTFGDFITVLNNPAALENMLVYFMGPEIQLTWGSGVMWIPSTSPLVTNYPDGVNKLSWPTSSMLSDMGVRAPGGGVGGYQLIGDAAEFGSGRVVGQGLNFPEGAGPMGHGGNVNPYEQYFELHHHSPATTGRSFTDSVGLIVSPSPCENNEAGDPCTTNVSMKVLSNPSGPGWQGVKILVHDVTDPNWYVFANGLNLPSYEMNEMPAPWIALGHEYEFKVRDNGYHDLTFVDVKSGAFGTVSPDPSGTNITSETKAPLTHSQTWVSCTNWGAGWYLFQDWPGAGAYTTSAPWVPASPNSCTFNAYDVSPGVYGGSRLLQSRIVHTGSGGGFMATQAASTEPPAALKATKKNAPPKANNSKSGSIPLPKYTGPVK